VKHTRRLKRTAFGTMLLTSTVLLFMMVGISMAVTDSVFIHGQDADGNPDPSTQIILRGPSGGAISSAAGSRAAFSAKMTCGHCHNGGITPDGFDGNGNPLLSYDDIERHSYHAQLGANQLKNFNPAGAKPWAQGVAHVGSW